MFSNARNLAGQAGALIMRFLAGWETHVQYIPPKKNNCTGSILYHTAIEHENPCS